MQVGPPLGFPSQVTVLAVAPGAAGSASAAGRPRVTGDVVVRIADDAAGVFSISALETLALTRDPDLPPGSGRAWETDQTVTTAGPIAIGAEEALAVTVAFSCPADPLQSTYTAQAQVFLDSDPTTVHWQFPCTGTVSVGTLDLVSTGVPAPLPGQTKDFDFEVRSSRRDEKGGAVSLDSATQTQFSAETQFCDVPAGATVPVTMSVTCQPDLPQGSYPLWFRLQDPFSHVEYGAVQVLVALTRTVTLFPSLDPGFALGPGESVRLEVRAVVSDGPGTFSLTASDVPAGVTVTPASQTVDVDGTVFIGLDIDLADSVPIGPLAPLILTWAVQEPVISGQLVFDIEVVPGIDEVVYDSGWAHAQTVQGWAQLAIHRNGDWFFRGHVHENGVVGDNYVFAVAVRPADASEDVLYIANSGTLGGTVDPFDDRDDDWNNTSGNDPRITDQWDSIVQRGSSAFAFGLHAATDPFQVVEAVIESLATAGVAIVVGALVALFSGPGSKCGKVGWKILPPKDDQPEGAQEVDPGAGFQVGCEAP